MSYRLNELGVVPNKTFKIIFPKWLNEELYPHFIRGYFDGDGYVGYNGAAKGFQFSLVGTEDFLLKIQEILIGECGHNKVKLLNRHPERKNNIRELRYCGNINSLKFYNFVYKNATIYLKRKKFKFNKLKKNYD